MWLRGSPQGQAANGQSVNTVEVLEARAHTVTTPPIWSTHFIWLQVKGPELLLPLLCTPGLPPHHLISGEVNYYFKQNEVGEKANACSKHRFSRVSPGVPAPLDREIQIAYLGLLDPSFSYLIR